MLSSRALRPMTGDDGVVAILVAVFAVVIFGFAAIIVDLGAARTTKSDAQNAADASVLAAAHKLYEDSSDPNPDFVAAVAAAKAYALANYGTTDAEWSACTDSGQLAYSPDTDCISFDEAAAPETVRVRIPPRRVGSFFGGIVGYVGLSVSAIAEAAVDRSTAPPECVFCLLGPGPHDLESGRLTVSGGDTSLNGNLLLDRDGLLQTFGTTNVHIGTINRPSRVSLPQAFPSTPLADPLASLAVPPAGTSSLPLRSAGSLCGTGSGNGPGRYGVVSLGNSSTACVLKPGLYVFTGPLSIDGSRDLDASAGVTLFFACGSGGVVAPTCVGETDPGRLSITGSGDVEVAASSSATPTGGAVKGLAILHARDNNGTLFIGGGGSDSEVSGTIYGPASSIDVRVSACAASEALQSLVVVEDILFPDAPGPCLRTSFAAAENVSVTTVTSGGLVR